MAIRRIGWLTTGVFACAAVFSICFNLVLIKRWRELTPPFPPQVLTRVVEDDAFLSPQQLDTIRRLPGVEDLTYSQVLRVERADGQALVTLGFAPNRSVGFALMEQHAFLNPSPKVLADWLNMPDGLLVDEVTLAIMGWRVGAEVEFRTKSGDRLRGRVAGTFDGGFHRHILADLQFLDQQLPAERRGRVVLVGSKVQRGTEDAIAATIDRAFRTSHASTMSMRPDQFFLNFADGQWRTTLAPFELMAWFVIAAAWIWTSLFLWWSLARNPSLSAPAMFATAVRQSLTTYAAGAVPAVVLAWVVMRWPGLNLAGPGAITADDLFIRPRDIVLALGLTLVFATVAAMFAAACESSSRAHHGRTVLFGVVVVVLIAEGLLQFQLTSGVRSTIVRPVNRARTLLVVGRAASRGEANAAAPRGSFAALDASAHLERVVDVEVLLPKLLRRSRLRGLQPDWPSLHAGVDLVAGQWPGGKPGFVIGQGIATREGLAIGDHVRVFSEEWPIVGYFSAHRSRHDDEFWCDANELDRLAGRHGGWLAYLPADEALPSLPADLAAVPDRIWEDAYYQSQASLRSHYLACFSVASVVAWFTFGLLIVTGVRLSRARPPNRWRVPLLYSSSFIGGLLGLLGACYPLARDAGSAWEPHGGVASAVVQAIVSCGILVTIRRAERNSHAR